METLQEQLEAIVKKSKMLKSDIDEDEDQTLGTINKYLDESVIEKCKTVLGD